jgi:Heparinase II/III-like protein/Heparinase II/III N-terminus
VSIGTAWYLRRLSRMGPREIAGRAVTAARVRAWRRELHAPVPPVVPGSARFTAVLPDGALAGVSAAAAAALLATADRIMDGYAEYFGVTRDDMVSPDWSRDPKTGRHAPPDAYAFDVPYRDEEAVGDVKQLWEPSRHQHLTVLAAAYALTGDDRYAHRVADHLKSWWAANPPMRGVHWISGIELGIRLISWVWVRRLLDGWPGVAALFEDNADARHQIHTHQRWLAAFPSRGSSANNHVIAEDAGRLVAACAFDWFPESATWRAAALASLGEQLGLNTFPSGINRELAFEYHGLVLELGLAAVGEARAAGLDVPPTTWRVLMRMTDALAAVVDGRLRPPRQGDADDGHGLVVDGDATDRWASLLATGDQLFGRADWWPEHAAADLRTEALAAMTGSCRLPDTRPATRPAHFADAGLTVLRAPGAGDGIWCRLDGGLHGFGSIAAHAHADALSVELRCGGVDVLADPGCYCYHGEPAWRSYFRSTLGHNTLELDGRDQSTSGGPFMWTRHAASRVVVAHVNTSGTSRWVGEHDGYGDRRRLVLHRRTVELDAVARTLRLVDQVDSPRGHRCRLAFHLGPAVEADLSSHRVTLRWIDEERPGGAVLTLPGSLQWSLYRGQADPPLGWYSSGFGQRTASTTLVGVGHLESGSAALQSELVFDD